MNPTPDTVTVTFPELLLGFTLVGNIRYGIVVVPLIFTIVVGVEVVVDVDAIVVIVVVDTLVDEAMAGINARRVNIAKLSIEYL